MFLWSICPSLTVLRCEFPLVTFVFIPGKTTCYLSCLLHVATFASLDQTLLFCLAHEFHQWLHFVWTVWLSGTMWTLWTTARCPPIKTELWRSQQRIWAEVPVTRLLKAPPRPVRRSLWGEWVMWQHAVLFLWLSYQFNIQYYTTDK